MATECPWNRVNGDHHFVNYGDYTGCQWCDELLFGVVDEEPMGCCGKLHVHEHDCPVLLAGDPTG